MSTNGSRAGSRTPEAAVDALDHRGTATAAAKTSDVATRLAAEALAPLGAARPPQRAA